MKRVSYISLIIAVVLAVSGVFSVNAQVRLSDTTGIISGTVTATRATDGIAATVTLKDSGGNIVNTVTTDVDGKYIFEDVPAGTGYLVTASKPAVCPVGVCDVMVVAGENTVINFSLGDPELEPPPQITTGSITGMVTSSGPLLGATITLQDSGGNVVNILTTDVDGKYIFEGVLAGTGYTISVVKQRFLPQRIDDVTVVAEEITTLDNIFMPDEEPPFQQVATPTVSHNGGTFTSMQKVTLNCATKDADIYYTIDGTAPTISSTHYTGPFTLTNTAMVNAFAVKKDMADSGIMSVMFTKKAVTSGYGGSTAHYYTVTFETDGGSQVTPQRIEKNNKATRPSDPVKVGFTFAGWYADEKLSQEYNFNNTVNSNITIYTKWTKNAAPEPKLEYITIIMNGVSVNFDVDPIIDSDRVLVPFRAILEQFGAVVKWDEATSTITAIINDKTIVLQLGKLEIYINGKMILLDVPPMLSGNRTLVPIRAISEGIGATVNWDDSKQQVIIVTQ